MKPELIPHHGLGLVAAEDAMRDVCDDFVARCNRKKGQLLLIMQKAPFGGVYYKLMDRESRRTLHSGIAKDQPDMLAHLEDSEKARIYETRTYGMWGE